jgi:hypothetical protein
MVSHRDGRVLNGRRSTSVRRFGLAGAGIFAALAGCRGILGIHDEPTIQCLTDANCLNTQFCDNAGFCVSGLDGSAEDGGDGASEAAPDGARVDADATVGDAVVAEAGTEAASDAGSDDGGPSPLDGTGPADTGADHTNPTNDASPPNDATADANNRADAGDAAAADTGTDANDANDMEDGSCSVSPSGTCAQCLGSCSVHRAGFLPEQGGNFSILEAHSFVAVQITVPSPAWLLRLGIQTSNNNVVGELALYEDSSGQPGAFVTKVDVTTLYDPLTDGSEESVDCDALCIPLTQGTYWVGAVFESTLAVLADNGATATIYQSDNPYPDGGTLADGVVPPGTISTDANDRNIYMVVTEP